MDRTGELVLDVFCPDLVLAFAPVLADQDATSEGADSGKSGDLSPEEFQQMSGGDVDAQQVKPKPNGKTRSNPAAKATPRNGTMSSHRPALHTINKLHKCSKRGENYQGSLD